jgi:lycopene cyclase domain-containing protein
MSLYSIIILCTIAVPFALSFDKKLQFYKQFKYLLPSITLVAMFYIALDISFTKLGVWGFTARYHSGIMLMHLPLEEWLFFIAIPYASIFLHDTLLVYFNSLQVKKRISNVLSLGFIIVSLTMIFFNFEKAYTVSILILLILVLIASFFDSSESINSFYLTFLIILLPFLAVNAILTGSFIAEPVVWYNNSENLGIRVLTIPIEDFGYAFSLLLFILILRAKLRAVFTNETKVRNG